MDMADFERGAKVSGFRGYFLKNDGALLSFAIWQYGLEFFMKKGGFSPMIVPSLVKKETMFGTGFLPQGEEDLYRTQDSEYLAGTAEVSAMGYYSEEILDKKTCQKNFCASRRASEGKPAVMGKMSKGLSGSMNFISWNKLFCAKPNIKSRSSGTNGSIETRKNLWSL